MSQDLSRDLYLIEEFRESGQWLISYGPKASVGNFYLPPFYYQLYIVVHSLFPSPISMTIVITLIKSLTPVLVYLLCKSLLSKKAAVVAAVVAACSPLAVIFGSFSWNPNMVPFFSLLSLLLLMKYQQKLKWEFLVLSLISFMIAFQLHYQATVLTPVFVILALKQIFYQQFRPNHWIIGALVAMLLMVPYAIAEVGSNYQNSKAVYNFVTEEHSRYFDRISKPYFVLTFVPAFFERVVLGNNTDYFWLGRFLLFFGLPVLIVHSYKRRQFLPFLYFLSILFMLRIYKGDKVDYYMSTLFVLPSLLLAAVFHWKKYVALPLIFYTLLSSGVYLGKIERVNDLKEIEAVLALLEQELPNRRARFILHDDDFANTIAYVMKKANIRIDQNSLVIVDVCKKDQPCILYPTTFSTRTKMEAFTSELRRTGKYHYVTTITPETLPFILHVGYLEQSPERTINHPLLREKDEQQFGSDILLKELFE
ncbi:MAG: glycosyltransferase family 39 protein [bacterium]|nr:glycosyltransferase family 39 protein [bacterium]